MPKKTKYRHPNDLPRPKIHLPGAYKYKEQAARLNPFNVDGLWFFADGDYYIRERDNKNKLPEVGGDCPVCFQLATSICFKCKSIIYCSKSCQTKHWHLARTRTYTTSRFLSISFVVFPPNITSLIKPTEKLALLTDICDNVLESPDHIMDVEGFGHDQIQSLWPMQNSSHPLQKKICSRFGWTSGTYGVELVEGYRMAEDKCIYMALNDDSFLGQKHMPPSYYSMGDPSPSFARQGKVVRGNVVIFKIEPKKKRGDQKPPPPPTFFGLILPTIQTSSLNMNCIRSPSLKLLHASRASKCSGPKCVHPANVANRNDEEGTRD